MEETTKLLLISVHASSSGLKEDVKELDVVETKSMYITQGRRVHKDRLMRIDTVMIETHKTIYYHTFCLPGDRAKALDMLKDFVKYKVVQYKEEIDQLYSAVFNAQTNNPELLEEKR